MQGGFSADPLAPLFIHQHRNDTTAHCQHSDEYLSLLAYAPQGRVRMKGVWQLFLIVCERKSHGKHERSFLYKENFSEVMFPFQREREGRGIGSDCVTQRLGFPEWTYKVRDFYSDKSLILQLSRTFFGYFFIVYVIFYPGI